MNFIDLEASSLHKGSFPTEVAWCSHDLTRGGSYLIRPVDGWTEWSPVSERLHGITLARLQAEGLPVAKVMEHLNADLQGEAVISDQPEFDFYWMGMLTAAAGVAMTFEFERTPLDAILAAIHGVDMSMVFSPLALPMLNREIGLVTHRALDDCIHHALELGINAIAEKVQGLQDAPTTRADAVSRMRSILIDRAKALLARHGRRP